MLPAGSGQHRTSCVERAHGIRKSQSLGLLRCCQRLSVSQAPLLIEHRPELQHEFGLRLLKNEIWQQCTDRIRRGGAAHVPLVPASRALSIRRDIEVHVATEGALEQPRHIWIHLHERQPDHQGEYLPSAHSLTVLALHVDAAVAVDGAGQVGKGLRVHSQHFTPRPGMQGRFTAEEWALKEYPT